MPDLIFHGTGREYHRKMVKKYGVYRHDSGNVFVSHLPEYAMERAIERSEKAGDWPILLVIRREQVRNLKLDENEIWPSCPMLDPSWYDVVESKKRKIVTKSKSNSR